MCMCFQFKLPRSINKVSSYAYSQNLTSIILMTIVYLADPLRQAAAFLGVVEQMTWELVNSKHDLS